MNILWKTIKKSAILCDLFIWKRKIDRNKTTKNFQGFEKYYKAENQEKKEYDSHENFLVKYIIETKSSPFIGDDNLEEARKLLVEQGIKKKII